MRYNASETTYFGLMMSKEVLKRLSDYSMDGTKSKSLFSQRKLVARPLISQPEKTQLGVFRLNEIGVRDLPLVFGYM